MWGPLGVGDGLDVEDGMGCCGPVVGVAGWACGVAGWAGGPVGWVGGPGWGGESRRWGGRWGRGAHSKTRLPAYPSRGTGRLWPPHGVCVGRGPLCFANIASRK